MPGLRLAGTAAAAVLLIGIGSGAARAQLMIVGNDEKVTFGADGKAVPHPPGNDSVSIVDISKPATPRIAATFPLNNTVVGPPTNLAIHPSGEIALIANSINAEPDGAGWKNVPDDKVFVIDLKANPPTVILLISWPYPAASSQRHLPEERWWAGPKPAHAPRLTWSRASAAAL